MVNASETINNVIQLHCVGITVSLDVNVKVYSDDNLVLVKSYYLHVRGRLFKKCLYYWYWARWYMSKTVIIFPERVTVKYNDSKVESCKEVLMTLHFRPLAITATKPLWFLLMPVTPCWGRSMHEYPGGVSQHNTTSCYVYVIIIIILLLLLQMIRLKW